MTGRADRLADLARIATLLSDRMLHPVAEANARVGAAEVRLAEVAAHRTRLQAATDDPVQAALMARQAERLRRSQVAALSDLARLRAEAEAAKSAARPAFGRARVLDRLLAKPPDKRK